MTQDAPQRIRLFERYRCAKHFSSADAERQNFTEIHKNKQTRSLNIGQPSLVCCAAQDYNPGTNGQIAHSTGLAEQRFYLDISFLEQLPS
jgi:hypothetical protein